MGISSYICHFTSIPIPESLLLLIIWHGRKETRSDLSASVRMADHPSDLVRICSVRHFGQRYDSGMSRSKSCPNNQSCSPSPRSYFKYPLPIMRCKFLFVILNAAEAQTGGDEAMSCMISTAMSLKQLELANHLGTKALPLALVIDAGA